MNESWNPHMFHRARIQVAATAFLCALTTGCMLEAEPSFEADEAMGSSDPGTEYPLSSTEPGMIMESHGSVDQVLPSGGDPIHIAAPGSHNYVVASEWVSHTGTPGDHIHSQALRCTYHVDENLLVQNYDLGDVYYFWNGGWTPIAGNDTHHNWHKGYRCTQGDYETTVVVSDPHEWHSMDPNYCRKCGHRRWP